ncbi:DUF2079 domain-containing protein [Brachybacterium sp. DNPG3]
MSAVPDAHEPVPDEARAADPAPASAPEPSPAPSPAHPRFRLLVPIAIALAGALAYGLLGWQQWRNLVAPSWDLGIFTELAKAYGSFSAPIVPIKGDDVNLLGDHFHPILVLLAPVWWVWPSGLALVWTQAVLFGASAIPLAKLAIDRLGRAMGTVVGVGYVFSFGLQAAADVQFHEIAFAVPLLALSLTALLRERVMAAALWAMPLVLVKEDLGLTVMVLGLVIALRYRTPRAATPRDATPRAATPHDRTPHDRTLRDHRITGFGLACWGAGWFLLSTFVILPLLNTAGQYDYTDKLGSVLDVFVPGTKWVTVLMLVAAAGVIGARSPLIWLMLPTLAWRFTGTVEFYWGWTWHYGAVLMPIACAALLDALGDRRTGRATSLLRRDRPLPSRTVRWTAAIASAATVLTLGAQIPVLDVLRSERWELTWRAEPAQGALDAMPDGAVAAVDITLLAYAVPDHDVQWMHGPNLRVPDCALIDQYAFSWRDDPPRSASDAEAWATLEWGAGSGNPAGADVVYTTVYDDGGFLVVCRDDIGAD